MDFSPKKLVTRGISFYFPPGNSRVMRAEESTENCHCHLETFQKSQNFFLKPQNFLVFPTLGYFESFSKDFHQHPQLLVFILLLKCLLGGELLKCKPLQICRLYDEYSKVTSKM